MKYAASKQLLLTIKACSSAFKYDPTKHSNLLKILSVKEVDEGVVGWLSITLADDSTSEDATSLLSAVKRFKEVNLYYNTFVIILLH